MNIILSKLFPHFHRVISSRLIFCLEIFFLWALLIGFITVNIIAVQKDRPVYWSELMKLFSSPFSVSRHMDLASTLWRQGQKPEARELMISAQSLTGIVQTRAQGNTANILGSMTSTMDTLLQWEREADELNRQYTFWQTVVAAKPDYRDALISLASLAYQLGKHDESRSWIVQALVLDPNHATAQTFARFLQGK